MYIKKFGSLVLFETVTTSGKRMIGGLKADGTRLLMDVVSSAIPDGQTSYMFDNKLIITVHWNNFTDEDREAVFNNTIKLRMGLFETGHCMFVKFGGYDWGDVSNLPGLISSFNDDSKPFDMVLFVFVDSATGEIVGTREFPINGEIASLVSYANGVSYRYFCNCGLKKDSYRVCSELYSDWSQATFNDSKFAREFPISVMENPKNFYGIDVNENDFAQFYKYG